MTEYKGYQIYQEKKSHHVHIRKDGRTVMHVPCRQKKTRKELVQMVAFYETVIGQLRQGTLRKVESEEELLWPIQG